jgi:hypothetical protein
MHEEILLVLHCTLVYLMTWSSLGAPAPTLLSPKQRHTTAMSLVVEAVAHGQLPWCAWWIDCIQV